MKLSERTRSLKSVAVIFYLWISTVSAFVSRQADIMSSVKANGGAIPPPPSISVPVWSLAVPSIIQAIPETQDPEKPSSSMNIITFANPCSIEPKLWMVSLYHNTLTKDSFLASKFGVLQLLSKEQKDLVPLLGKRSGYEENYNKASACQENGFKWVSGEGFTGKKVSLLPRCANYVSISVVSVVDAGDHAVAICKVLNSGRWDKKNKEVIARQEGEVATPLDEETVLYTGFLRKEGII